ncbi:hypothetical protein [Chamaesiphon sp. GL140_3_metabinner_50]|uniref:hypothetical protein n=1 Tax=Chamaesiphon sp. GL140_3_metabinner_50 TaxID=2970812 RepID=UPI0025D39B60|nr:hypothetical protein [Chamaesiphon sp. GL140_3_metabinner_50]
MVDSLKAKLIQAHENCGLDFTEMVMPIETELDLVLELRPIEDEVAPVKKKLLILSHHKLA